MTMGGFERDEVEERWVCQRPIAVGREWQRQRRRPPIASVANDVVWTGGGECRWWTCGVMEIAEFLFIYLFWVFDLLNE